LGDSAIANTEITVPGGVGPAPVRATDIGNDDGALCRVRYTSVKSELELKLAMIRCQPEGVVGEGPGPPPINWLNRMKTMTSSPIAVPDGRHDDVTVTVDPTGNTDWTHGE
jgi:hypothetical protein